MSEVERGPLLSRGEFLWWLVLGVLLPACTPQILTPTFSPTTEPARTLTPHPSFHFDESLQNFIGFVNYLNGHFAPRMRNLEHEGFFFGPLAHSGNAIIGQFYHKNDASLGSKTNYSGR